MGPGLAGRAPSRIGRGLLLVLSPERVPAASQSIELSSILVADKAMATGAHAAEPPGVGIETLMHPQPATLGNEGTAEAPR
jgi:hypothetical protein